MSRVKQAQPHDDLQTSQRKPQTGWYALTRLPRYGKRRWKGGKRYRKAGVAIIPNRVDISSRPEVIEQRSRLGDWEGDLVHGVNASLVTLVDRTSRFTLAQRVNRKRKEAVADALILMLGKVHSALTVTLDNGGEFADHAQVSNETGAAMYFTGPYASWQRGTNENTNGRLRRFWPKRFDLATLLRAGDSERSVVGAQPNTTESIERPYSHGSFYWSTCCTYYVTPALFIDR